VNLFKQTSVSPPATEDVESADLEESPAEPEVYESKSQDESPVGNAESSNLREKEMYEFAVLWHAEHRDDITAAIEQFKTVVEETRGTKYSLMAQQEIRRLVHQNAEKEHADIADLRRRIQPLVDRHKFDKAVKVVHGYSGVHLDNTDEKLERIISSVRKKKEAWISDRVEKEAELKIERHRSIDSLVMAILSDDLNIALQKISEMKKSEAFATVTDKLNAVGDVLEKAVNIDQNILQSFESQYGETVDVYLNKGMRRLTIRGVSSGRIECRETLSVGHGAVSTINITVDDLSDYEKMRRMGDDSNYEVALVKGITAFQSGA
jgi:hypothetical protein